MKEPVKYAGAMLGLRLLNGADVRWAILKRTATGRYPPRSRTRFISKRAVRPLPSLHG